eukprot:TRINITY_DN24057_c0_g1_i1.p1 TRINITY_DN24057_c0_g1~~TRINITY_DN24057_c0_g1_i1.p1  ORF type:complete len:130 (+),score=42.81 TRINITY_DN24057_c0_g1_i1:71-460(+)
MFLFVFVFIDFFFFFQAEDGIRDAQESRGLGDVYKRQVLGSLDQTPFQVLLRRVALFTVDPATTVPAPDGGLIFTNHVNAVVTARREAALKAEELKAIKKAKAARNEMLVVGSIVVVFLAWVSRKMGIV